MTPSGKCACANSFEQMSLAIGLCFGIGGGGRAAAAGKLIERFTNFTELKCSFCSLINSLYFDFLRSTFF